MLAQFNLVDNALRHVNFDAVVPAGLKDLGDASIELYLKFFDVLAGDALPLSLVERGSPPMA